MNLEFRKNYEKDEDRGNYKVYNGWKINDKLFTYIQPNSNEYLKCLLNKLINNKSYIWRFKY